MTAYNPPLFSFTSLKFNRLIYEVADTVTAVASSIVNTLSIITNKIYTYDVSVSRELWTDSDTSPILIGTNTLSGGNDITIGGSFTATNNIGMFSLKGVNIGSTNGINGEIAIGDDITGGFIYVGRNLVGGGVLQFGSQTANFQNGNFQFYFNDIRSLTPADLLFLYPTTSASVQFAQGVSAGNYVSVGNTDCDIEIGGFLMSLGDFSHYDPLVTVNAFNDSSTLHLADNSNYLFLGHGQIAGDLLYLGTQANTNYIGGFRLINQTLISQVTTNAVNLFNNNTGAINIGTGQGAGQYIYIGSLTNTMQIGGLYWNGQNIYPYDVATTLSIGSTLTAALQLGNSTNTNQLGKFVHTGTAMTMAGPLSTAVDLFPDQTGSIRLGSFTHTGQTMTSYTNTNPVNLFNDNTGQISLGTSQVATNIIQVGNTTNINKVGGFRIDNQDLSTTSLTATTNVLISNQIVNIATAQATLDTLTLGSGFNANKIGIFTFKAGDITSTNTTASVTLFGNILTGGVTVSSAQSAGASTTIGNSVNTNKVGNYNFIGNAITSSSATTSTTFMNNLTTGSLSIATAQTTGQVSIGSTVSTINIGPFFRFTGSTLAAGSSTATVNMMNDITTGSGAFFNGLTGGSLAIATNQNAIGSVGIGSALSLISIGTNFRFQANALVSLAVTDAMTIFNNLTTGSGQLFNGLTTGSLSIMSAATSGFCNIGGTALTTGGLRIYNAITLGYTTLTTPTANQVGYIQTGTGTLNSVTPTTTTLRTLSLGVGVWILSAKAWANSSATYVSLFISNTNNAISTTHASILTGTTSGNNAGSIMKYLTVTSGTTTQYFTADASGTYTLQGVSFEAIRIA